MFALFNRFKQPIDIVGKDPEKIVLTRVGKSNASNFKSNFVFTGLLQENTKLQNGDLFSCTVKGTKKDFIVVALRPSAESVQATVYMCNGTISVTRKGEEKYNEDGDLIGTELVHVLDTPCNHVTVNANMRMMDAGLLPSTTKEFRVPICDINLLDRITLDGKNYCVDAIDTTKFAGLLAVQTSDDNRNL